MQVTGYIKLRYELINACYLGMMVNFPIVTWFITAKVRDSYTNIYVVVARINLIKHSIFQRNGIPTRVLFGTDYKSVWRNPLVNVQDDPSEQRYMFTHQYRSRTL